MTPLPRSFSSAPRHRSDLLRDVVDVESKDLRRRRLRPEFDVESNDLPRFREMIVMLLLLYCLFCVVRSSFFGSLFYGLIDGGLCDVDSGSSSSHFFSACVMMCVR